MNMLLVFMQQPNTDVLVQKACMQPLCCCAILLQMSISSTVPINSHSNFCRHATATGEHNQSRNATHPAHHRPVQYVHTTARGCNGNADEGIMHKYPLDKKIIQETMPRAQAYMALTGNCCCMGCMAGTPSAMPACCCLLSASHWSRPCSAMRTSPRRCSTER